MVVLGNYFYHISFSFIRFSNLHLKQTIISAAITFSVTLLYSVMTLFGNQLYNFLPSSFLNLNFTNFYPLLRVLASVFDIRTLSKPPLLYTITYSKTLIKSLPSLRPSKECASDYLAFLCAITFGAPEGPLQKCLKKTLIKQNS